MGPPSEETARESPPSEIDQSARPNSLDRAITVSSWRTASETFADEQTLERHTPADPDRSGQRSIAWLMAPSGKHRPSAPGTLRSGYTPSGCAVAQLWSNVEFESSLEFANLAPHPGRPSNSRRRPLHGLTSANRQRCNGLTPLLLPVTTGSARLLAALSGATIDFDHAAQALCRRALLSRRVARSC